MMNQLITDMSIAYAVHEAGHAIVGIAFGRAVESLTVLTRRDVGGLCGFVPDQHLPDASERIIEAAGEAAMALFAPAQTHRVRTAAPEAIREIFAQLPDLSADDPLGPTDWRRIRLAVAVEIGAVPFDDQVNAAFTAAAEQARLLLSWFSVEVRIVAAALAERRTLCGADVMGMIGDLMPAPPEGSVQRTLLSATGF